MRRRMKETIQVERYKKKKKQKRENKHKKLPNTQVTSTSTPLTNEPYLRDL